MANTSFDLSGLVIDSSNATLNVSTYAGLTATFSADGTALTLTGTVDKAVAAFSDSALPSVATASQVIQTLRRMLSLSPTMVVYRQLLLLIQA